MTQINIGTRSKEGRAILIENTKYIWKKHLKQIKKLADTKNALSFFKNILLFHIIFKS